MKLIAVSGGVDSMVLAHLHKNEDVVLAFVNYNIREDTNIDQEIVESFAKENNLKLEILTFEKGQKNYFGNFQNWARKKRYQFFYEVYKKYNCNELLIAHHKDDFLETCLMQYQKNKNKLFYGINDKATYLGMNVYRPLLFKYWKHEIYKYAYENQIRFNDDSSNFESKYTRNKIRNQLLSNLDNKEKNKMFNFFIEINKNNEQINEEINNEYKIWKNSDFDKKIFLNLINKQHLVVSYVNNHFEEANLNKNIIENIIKFICSNENKKIFKLNNNCSFIKLNNKLLKFK